MSEKWNSFWIGMTTACQVTHTMGPTSRRRVHPKPPAALAPARRRACDAWTDARLCRASGMFGAVSGHRANSAEVGRHVPTLIHLSWPGWAQMQTAAADRGGRSHYIASCEHEARADVRARTQAGAQQKAALLGRMAVCGDVERIAAAKRRAYSTRAACCWGPRAQRRLTARGVPALDGDHHDAAPARCAARADVV